MRTLNAAEIDLVCGAGWTLDNKPDAYSKAISSSEANKVFKGMVGGAIAGSAGGVAGVALGMIGGALAAL